MASEQQPHSHTSVKRATIPPVKKRAPTLYAIIVFKLVKGLLFMGFSIYLYVEAKHDLPDKFNNFISSPFFQGLLYHLRINPDNRFFQHLTELIDGLTNSKIYQASLAAFLLSLFPLVEGVGLMYRVPWAGWLAIGESLFFVPIEVYKLIRVPTWSIFIVTICNIVVVGYLYAYRDVLFKHHLNVESEEPDTPEI